MEEDFLEIKVSVGYPEIALYEYPSKIDFSDSSEQLSYCSVMVKLVKTNEEDSKQKINDILEELKKHINESLKIENFNVSEYIHEKYASTFDLILGVVVPELRNYKEEKETFWDLISQYFNLSLQIETNNSMGLFFAGYGQNDAFPKFIHLDIYTVINGELKYRIKDKFDESNNGAKIVSLAQGDVIMTFCKGISEYFINYIPQKVDEIIIKKIESL